MLTKPINGRCKFLLFDVEVQVSCVVDFPVDWLSACKYSLEDRNSVYLPISLVLLDNGYEYAAVRIDECGVSVTKITDGTKSVFHYDVSLAEFIEELLRDIEGNLDEWANWYPAEILGGPDAGRKEMLMALLADTRQSLARYAEKNN